MSNIDNKLEIKRNDTFNDIGRKLTGTREQDVLIDSEFYKTMTNYISVYEDIKARKLKVIITGDYIR